MTVVVFRNDHGGLKIDRSLLKNRFVEFGRMPSSIFSFVLVESGFRLTISAVVHVVAFFDVSRQCRRYWKFIFGKIGYLFGHFIDGGLR